MQMMATMSAIKKRKLVACPNAFLFSLGRFQLKQKEGGFKELERYEPAKGLFQGHGKRQHKFQHRQRLCNRKALKNLF